MGVGHRSLAHHGRGDRQVGRFLQRGQRVGGAGQVHAAAGDDHRPLGLCNQPCRFAHAAHRGHSAIQRELAHAGAAPRGDSLLQQHVGRQHQRHRAGTA